jgi:hypothetical protein
LLGQDQLAGPPGREVGLFHSVTPLIEHSPGYSELPCKPDDIAAGVHPFNSLSAKLTTVSLAFSSFHFAGPFPQSVHDGYSLVEGSDDSAELSKKLEPSL